MVSIVFDADSLATAYNLQRKGVRDFEIDHNEWHMLFKDPKSQAAQELRKHFERKLSGEYERAKKLLPAAEKEWRACEERVVRWIKNITKLHFKSKRIRVSIVASPSGVVPFRDIPLMIIGKGRGWGYPETIAHELAHIIFNQNLNLDSEVEHPYVQLIEEEVAVRLGVRSNYFAYAIPDFADWVKRAQKIKPAWLHYLSNLDEFRDISDFIRKCENANVKKILKNYHRQNILG
jgi:hypothetical protein